jgi:hypothetical protein
MQVSWSTHAICVIKNLHLVQNLMNICTSIATQGFSVMNVGSSLYGMMH